MKRSDLERELDIYDTEHTYCLATSSGQRYSKPFVTVFQVREHCLDAFFLILSELDFHRGFNDIRYGGRRGGEAAKHSKSIFDLFEESGPSSRGW